MFKVGQKVWCAIYGAGVVEEIHRASGGVYPVEVNFSDVFYASYTSDGKWFVEGNIALFPYPVEIVKATVKPSIDWSHVKAEYKWLSDDESGSAFVFENMPFIDGRNYWQPSDGACFKVDGLASYVRGTCDWKDSLVKRPE